MSQDLFAAFNAISDEKPTTLTTTEPQANIEPEEDDDFGDFEDASIQPAPTLTTKPAAPSLPFDLKAKPSDGPEVGSHPFAGRMDILFDVDDDEYDAGEDDLYDLSKNPEAAMEYSKRIIEEQSKAATQPQSRSDVPGNSPSREVEETRRPKDPNVLFDAEDVSDGNEQDDWGDFEGTSSPPQQVKDVSNSMDLLGMSDEVSPAISKAPMPSPQKRTQTPKAAPITTRATPDDAWDDFEESLPTISTAQAYTDNDGPQHPPPQSRRPTKQEDLHPPTNIPPPALLLSLFPSLITSAHESLFDPLSKLAPKERQTLLSHPATQKFLQNYIAIGIVLGHVIAGRKSRWKRDQILAQSTRIGPSAAGGKGGMKLAGLDKSEAAKEDREVVDVVRLWRGQVGKLRSAVGAMRVPDITEQIPVQVLKQAQGGYVAPHACALCGLRREERAVKVDVNVDDSFGEWWVEGMHMHLTCRNFWEEYKGKLKSR